MPLYRDVAISLQTQYDARFIPEYAPPAAPAPPQRQWSKGSLDSYRKASNSSTNAIHADAEVFVPIYEGSQFWVHYACVPPARPDEVGEADVARVKYYYFKLLIGGKCILSWGVGERDGWHGKVSFGIYDGGTDFGGHQIVERRSFFFGKDTAMTKGGSFEIKMYRAKARKRENVVLEKFEKGTEKAAGFCINNAGNVKGSDPKKMYQYALIDAVDKPYVTFRYQLRTSAQLHALGINLTAQDPTDLASSPPPTPRSLSPETDQPSPPAPAIPTDNLSSHRLSFPPRTSLLPPSKSIHRGSPIKKHAPLDEGEALARLDEMSLVDQRVPTSSSIEPTRVIPDWVMKKPLPARPDEEEPASKGSAFGVIKSMARRIGS